LIEEEESEGRPVESLIEVEESERRPVESPPPAEGQEEVEDETTQNIVPILEPNQDG